MASPLLSRKNSVLVVIDMQEKLLAHIAGREGLIRRAALLAASARRLGVPIIVTEQYPKGLGPTVAEIGRAVGEFQPVVKTDFSCAAVPQFMELLGSSPGQAVVCGVEAHVCVSQTVLDLESAGWRVFVVLDAIGSRRASDRDAAVARMTGEGAAPVTAESAVFEWLRKAEGEEFKDVQRMIKETA